MPIKTWNDRQSHCSYYHSCILRKNVFFLFVCLFVCFLFVCLFFVFYAIRIHVILSAHSTVNCTLPNSFIFRHHIICRWSVILIVYCIHRVEPYFFILLSNICPYGSYKYFKASLVLQIASENIGNLSNKVCFTSKTFTKATLRGFITNLN